MRIAIDLQSCQSASRHHGIGRYSMAIVREIIQQSTSKHEIWVLLNAQLNPETIPAIKQSLQDLIPEKQVVSFQVPTPNDAQNIHQEKQKASEYIREYFIESLQPDILYITSLFEGMSDHATTSIGALNENLTVAVIQYDLIPYIQQDIYLGNIDIKSNYLKKIKSLNKADCILTISAYSKKESEQHLSVATEKIINVSSAVTANFTSLPAKNPAHQKSLLAKYNIQEKYIFYAPSGFDQRKNVVGLIKAYALLPQSVQVQYHLVLAGTVKNLIKLGITELLDQLKITEQVVMTGYVSDDELVGLYQDASLFVFPSFHEGFGLPALEAMSIGVPTIGAKRTSLIEVIGLEEALFDPDDNAHMSKLIEQSLIDTGFRQRLITHAKKHSKTFSWKKSAKATLKALEQCVNKSTKQPNAWQGLEQNQASYQKLITKIQRLQLSEQDNIQIANNLAANEHTLRQVLRQNRPLKSSPVWQIAGPFDSSYSLALLNRQTAKALAAAEQKVSLFATEGPGDYQADAEYLKQHQDINALHQNVGQQGEVDILSRNLYPPRVHDMNAPINLLHHYAWEESGFPVDWVDDFNFYLQGISCLSTHVEKIMRDNGVSVPLITSGCGVDHWAAIKADTEYKIKAKAFRFLHVSSCFPRKGVDVLLSAYAEAFTKEDSVSLIIKTFSNPHNTIKQQLKDAQQANKNYPDVVIIEQDLTDAQLKSIYQQCHVMVAPSRAEGFGLPMAEAMLSGLPVITTAWGGQLDFCHTETAWLIDYDFEMADTHLPTFDSVWAEPKQSHLAELMQKAYTCSNQERQTKVTAGQRQLGKNFQWQQVVQRHQAFALNLPEKAAKPRMAWVSTWNTKCGIAVYSQSLLACFSEEPQLICANKTQGLLYDDASHVHRNWTEDNLKEIATQVEAMAIDVVMIQFNYFFFDYQQLSALITRLTDLGKQVVIELHSTQDPDFAPEKALKHLVPSLEKCNTLLVHSVNDLNQLKKIGLINNVSLFPLGINRLPDITEQEIAEPALKAAIKRPETFVIATYGFFLPHKGLMEMVLALKELVSMGHHCHLLMLNAEYPVDVSAIAIQQVKKVIAETGVEQHVTLKTDFLDDALSLAYLSAADLIVFPYQKTGEAASAAVRYGITVQKPVAVTPLRIFDDIKQVSFQLPGIDPKSIAVGLNKLIEQINNKSPEIQEIQEIQAQWYKAHIYPVTARRLENMMTSINAIKKAKKLKS
ncbi:MAG: glycosyltransferase [Methylococcales bacterium]